MKELKTRGDSHSLKIAIFLALFGFFSCGEDTTSEDRAVRASSVRGDILVGIVDKSGISSTFRKGVELAIEEINQAGGVLGRKLSALYYTDRNEIEKGKRIARKLAKNLDMIAVIGHLDPDVAVSASVIYERAGLLFLSYGVARPALMQFGGEYTFTNIPDAEEAGRLLVGIARDAGKSKAVVISERSTGVKRFVDILNEQATRNEMEVVATRSFFSYEHDFRSLDWTYDFKEVIWMLKKEYEFDAIFIVGDLRPAAVLIRQLRGLGVDARIYGGGGLDSPRLHEESGGAAEGMIIATMFNPDHPGKTTRLFVDRFASRFESTPDKWAAQGYDSIRMLASAIQQSGSAEPADIAGSLRFLKEWPGVSGSLAFTPDGHIVNKTIFLKTIVDGKFVYLDPDGSKNGKGGARASSARSR